MAYRAAIGFIVEGHGEFNCYPSLYCNAVHAPGLNVPRINASGCGDVVRNVREHLTDMCRTFSPYKVIVTVDFVDVIKQNLAADCADLVAILNAQINGWSEDAANDGRIAQLPMEIVAVIQVRKFESWLIADTQGLIDAGLVDPSTRLISDAEAIDEPVKWIRENVNLSGDVKSPQFAKVITSALNPSRMINASHSFDKFYRECCAGYEAWAQSG